MFGPRPVGPGTSRPDFGNTLNLDELQGTSHLRPLLKVLTVLPEELSSRTLRLDANRRSEVLQLFTASTEDVLQLLVLHNHSYYLSRF